MPDIELLRTSIFEWMTGRPPSPAPVPEPRTEVKDDGFVLIRIGTGFVSVKRRGA